MTSNDIKVIREVANARNEAVWNALIANIDPADCPHVQEDDATLATLGVRSIEVVRCTGSGGARMQDGSFLHF